MPHEATHVFLASKSPFSVFNPHFSVNLFSPLTKHTVNEMGKKMKLPFLLRNSEPMSSSSSSSWPWPSCHQPKTLSFRAKTDIFKTINSAYLVAAMDSALERPESFFTNSPESASFSSASEEYSGGGDPIETVIHGLRSETERLFFEPDETSSILEAKTGNLPFKDSVVLFMDSRDPYVDFRKSMEEMVEAHGVKNWDNLEELLCWYLRVNEKRNHGYIVGAFVDLLVGLEFASCDSSSSPLSFYTTSSNSLSSFGTPCVSCLEADSEDSRSSSLLLEEIKEEIKVQDEEASSSSNV